MSLITFNAKEYRIMTAQSMSQNPAERSLRDFLSLRHPNHFVQTIETSSLPTDSSRPLFKNIEIFSGILTVYFAPLGEIPAGAIIQL